MEGKYFHERNKACVSVQESYREEDKVEKEGKETDRQNTEK
jgi:hypothetical protein